MRLNDYHLKSQHGRRHPASRTWVKDLVHNPGIYAGSPAAEFVNAILTNGAHAHLETYGNTYEARKSNRVDIPFLAPHPAHDPADPASGL